MRDLLASRKRNQGSAIIKDSDANKLGLAISGLLENDGPFAATSVAIVSTHSLPASLRAFQYAANVA